MSQQSAPAHGWTDDLPGPPSSILDQQETSSPSDVKYYTLADYVPYFCDYRPPDQLELDFRHSGWTRIRELIFTALQRTQTKPKTIEAFWGCGKSLWLDVRDDGQALRCRCDCCHNRWCQPCMRARATFIRGNLDKHIKGRTVRFLTLTLRHNNTPLRDQIDRLYRSFNAFRRRDLFRQHVTGGAAILEIKVGRDDKWHPHLHCLVEGNWWELREISSEWLAVTGDSSIVHIRRTDGPGQATAYATKYLTKPVDNSIYHQPVRLDEVISALHGRRIINTFGTWRKLKLTPKAPETERHTWTPVGSIVNLHYAAENGDLDALRWIEAWHRHTHPTQDAGAPHDAAP